MSWHDFGTYVSVSQKKGRAENLVRKMKKTRPDLQPVCPAGRNIARSFWGKAWCKHLETYADHENRIERGRSYVRNGAVCHLEAEAGRLGAIVAGSRSEPYEVRITVKPLPDARWKAVKAASAGHIGSLVDLLSGKFPEDIMVRAADSENGLFPRLGELEFRCSCPDQARMCKHVAATLYAFGHRLDQSPELLFLVRGVDPAELVNMDSLVASTGLGTGLEDASLADIFGIELDLKSLEETRPDVHRSGQKK